MAEAHQRARGAGRALGRSVHRRSTSCTASRVSTKTACAIHTPAFDTYARALALDNGNEETLGTSSGSRWSCNRWPQVAKLYDAELDKLADEPERFVELGLRTAQIYEVQLEDVDNAIARYRRVLEVDPENQNAVRSLDRLFVRTERWADLAAGSRARGRDRSDARRDPRVQVPPRPGLRASRLNDLDAAIAAYREVFNAAPEHEPTLEALEAPLRARAPSRSRSPRSSSRSTSAAARVGEARSASTRRSSRTPSRDAGASASRCTTASPSSSKRSSSTSGRDARRLHPRAQGSARSTRSRAKRSSAWPARSTAAGRRSPTPTPTFSACTTTRTSSASIGRRLARTFEDELGDITKAEETYRYVLGVEPLDHRCARQPRSHLHSRSSSGPISRRSSSSASRRPTEPHELVELYARLGEIYEEKLATGRRRDSRLPPDLRRARQDARGRDPGPRAHLRAEAGVDRAQHGLRARARERLGRRRRRPRSAPRSRTSPRIAWATRRAPSTPGSSSSISAAKIPRRSARSRTSTSSRAVGRARATCSSAQFDIADTDDDRVERAHAPRADLPRAARPRRAGARRLATAFSTSTTPTSPRLRAIAAIWRTRQDPNELVAALHADRRSRRGDARRRGAQGDLPRARQDVRRACSGSRSTPPTRGASCSRSIRPTSRRWTPSRRSTAARAVARRHRRQDAARRRARRGRREDPELLAGRRASGSERSTTRTAAPRRTRRSSTIDADARRAFNDAREAPHRGLALGAAHRALSRRASRRATETARTNRPSAPHRARLRGEARRQGPGLRRARQRVRRGLPRSRDGQVPRAHGAGHRALGRAHPDRQHLAARRRRIRSRRSASASTSPSGTATTSVTPSTRSRTTRRSSSSIRTTSSVLRQMGQPLSQERRSGSSSAQTLTRALDVAITDIDRKEILTELGELLERQMNADRSGARVLHPRARGRSAASAGAREPRAHLHGARREPRARRRAHAQGARRSSDSRAIATHQAAHRRRSTRRT